MLTPSMPEGWVTKEHLIRAVVPGQKNDIICFEDCFFFTSASSALVHFPPLLSPRRSTMVHSPREALNSMTKQGTTAKCPAHSTMRFVPSSLESCHNPGQTLAPKPPSATCSSKTLTPSSTTMLSATPSPPATMGSTNPSCSPAIELIWQKYLPGLRSS